MLARTVACLRGLLRRHRIDAEAADELRFHLAQEMDAHVARDLSPAEARRVALRDLGGVFHTREAIRDVRATRFDTLGRDLTYALRRLRREPALSATALATLALVSGAAIVCFSLMNAIVLKPRPVDHPEQLVAVSSVDARGQRQGLDPRVLQALTTRNDVLTILCGYGGDTPGLPVTVHGERVRSSIELVSGGYFDVLGIHALVGRLLAPADDGPTPATTQRVAVLSERFWRERFAGAPGAIGDTIAIAGERFAIVGIAPATFIGMWIEAAPDVVVPAQALAAYFGTAPEPTPYQYLLGRLQTNATLAATRAELEGIWPRVLADTVGPTLTADARQHALSLRPVVTSVATGFSFLRPQYQTTLTLLTTLAGWMLLTACVSLAGLLVARAIARVPEFRLRVTLGASRADLVRQLLIESALLAVGGTLAGLLLAAWGAPVLLRLLWPAVPNMTVNLAPDWRVVAATMSLAMGMAALLSVAPAWIASRQARIGASRHSRTVTTSHTRLSDSLLAAQLGVSLVLVIGAGLFVRTLANLSDTDLGFEVKGLLAIMVEAKPDGYGWNDLAYYPALLADLTLIPGVQGAALMPHNPFGGTPSRLTAVAPAASPADSPASLAATETVSPDFFATLGIPLLRGRDFTWRDTPDAPPVAVLSASLAATMFARGNEVGQQIRVGPETGHRATVVGIVADSRFDGVHAPGPATLYLSKVQEQRLEGASLVVRTSMGSASVESEIRRRIEAFGREDVYRVDAFEADLTAALTRERLDAAVGACFGGLAIFLAAIGAYGLISQSVARRTREMGLRLALGASPSGLGRLVLRQSVRLALIGVAIGLPGAWVSARLAASQLYGVSAHDPLVFGGASVALVGTVILAACLPARRALRLSPTDALRMD